MFREAFHMFTLPHFSLCLQQHLCLIQLGITAMQIWTADKPTVWTSATKTFQVSRGAKNTKNSHEFQVEHHNQDESLTPQRGVLMGK